MITNYGTLYSHAAGIPGRLRKPAYSVRRLGYKRWLVYLIGTDKMITVVPTRLRAYYVATVLSGVDVS